jgi:hypothetical protein
LILSITRHDDYLIFRTPGDPVSMLAAAAPMSIASAELMVGFPFVGHFIAGHMDRPKAVAPASSSDQNVAPAFAM